MTKDLRFKKENGKWYIDLPFWPGPKHALMMVAGANKLLNYVNSYTGNTDIVECIVSTKYKLRDGIYLQLEEKSLFGGATYCVRDSISNAMCEDKFGSIWLCPVTLFVFGRYPKIIYITFKNLSSLYFHFNGFDVEDGLEEYNIVSSDFAGNPLVFTIKKYGQPYIFIHLTQKPNDLYMGFEASEEEINLVSKKNISFDEYKELLKELYNKAKRYFITDVYKIFMPHYEISYEELDINTEDLTDSYRYDGGPIGVLGLVEKGIMMDTL